MASRSLRVEIIGDASSLKRSFGEASNATGNFGRVTTGLKSQIGGLAKAFIGTAAVFEAGTFLKSSIESAEKLRKGQESLSAAIQHTGGNVRQLLPQYTATAKAAAQFGITQADATTALSKATLLTGSAESAQRAYNEAVVISKATGKDFNSVLVATSKGQDGITTSLRRYGVLLPSTASGQDQLNQVMKTFGGQAEANTSAADKLHANFDNLKTNIGTALLPAFNEIVTALDRVVKWLQSPEVAAGFQKFADTAKSLMQPIVDWVKTNWPQIKTTIESVMNGVKEVISNIVGVVRALWDTFGGAILQMTKTYFQTTFTVIGDLMRAIRDTIRFITDVIHGHWSAAWDDLKGIVSNVLGAAVAIVRGTIDNFATAALAIGKAFVAAIVSGLKALGGAIASAVLGPLDAVIGKIKEVIGWAQAALSAIGSVASSSATHNVGSNPAIAGAGRLNGPGRAVGGPVIGGMSYIVGERGPELFVPAANGAIIPNGRGGGGNTFNFNFPQYVGSRDELARTLRDELVTLGRREPNIFGGFA